LSILEILVHLSDLLPDKYVLGSADLPENLSPEVLAHGELPDNWTSLATEDQDPTRTIGDEWVRRLCSAVLSVPSVTSGERNILLNPEHPQFRIIDFHEPVPFRFDMRLLKTPSHVGPSPKLTSH
jgi:RES domain-containing protein